MKRYREGSSQGLPNCINLVTIVRELVFASLCTVEGSKHERSWFPQLGLLTLIQFCQQWERLAMNSEDAAADRGITMAMPALLDEEKRMLEVLFVYALRAFTTCYTRNAVRIFLVLVADTFAKSVAG